jgi:hypothetical protein
VSACFSNQHIFISREHTAQVVSCSNNMHVYSIKPVACSCRPWLRSQCTAWLHTPNFAGRVPVSQRAAWPVRRQVYTHQAASALFAGPFYGAATVSCISCRSQISKYESDRQMVMQAEHLQDNTVLQQVSATCAQPQQVRQQQA